MDKIDEFQQSNKWMFELFLFFIGDTLVYKLYIIKFVVFY